MQLHQNYFDPSIHRNTSLEIFNNSIKKGTIVVWDDWYSVMEGKVNLLQIKNDRRFNFKKSFQILDENNNQRSFYIFVKN